MKIVGLITEYNPFHNGHRYHLEQALKITKADAAIVIMSGNYVQRGAPAMMPKHLRTEMALKSGAALVLELPLCYACGSAEYFAKGALATLEQLGCVDSICFGSECGDPEVLETIARITAFEPDQYQELLQAYLRQGQTFPLARQHALKEYLKRPELDQILDRPNNILGIEYIKCLLQSKSKMSWFTIKRQVSDYHDTELSESYSSASAIRRLLARSTDQNDERAPLCDILIHLEDHVPASCLTLLEQTHLSRYPVYANDFSLLLKYKLLSETPDSLQQYVDVSFDLARRIINHRHEYRSFEQFCELLKTKEVTYSRISRVLLHILLDLKTADLQAFLAQGTVFYAHILGFRKQDSALLTQLKQHSSLPLITRPREAESLPPLARQMFDHDLLAADLYESVITEKYHNPFIAEATQAICKI